MARKMALMDWRAMKYYHVRCILVPLTVIFIGLVSSPLLVLPTSVMLFVFFSLNPFAVEEKGALNNLYLTLPVSRSDIVSGRFVLGGVMGLCGLVLGVPLMVLVNTFGSSRYYIRLGEYVFILAVSYLLFSLFILATYPVLFKLGYNKGKFWGLFLPAIFMGVIYGAVTLVTRWPGKELLPLQILAFAYENMLPVSGGIAVVATGLLAAAVALSKRIYAKRDF